MKITTSSILSIILLGAGANAQVPCRAANEPSPQNAPQYAYTKVLNNFWHASFDSTTATLDPLTRHFEIVNNGVRRRIVCHYFQGDQCFWVNGGDTCIVTLPQRYVDVNNPGFIRTWLA